MVWYCYETVNKVNGKYYRGKSGSSNPEKDGYLGSGTLLKKAIQKYGRAAFCKKILFFPKRKDAKALSYK